MFGTLLIQDPMIGLELCAILMTLAYLGRLTLSTELPSFVPPKKKGKSSFSAVALRLFDVGNLISLPKRSLRGQTA